MEERMIGDSLAPEPSSAAREAISTLDNLLRTLIIAGVILIAGLVIAHPNSRSMAAAVVSLFSGFLLFILASQFLVSMEMSSEMTPIQQAKSLRIGIPFLLGWLAYATGGVLVCLNFLLR